jgi:hypothetical protein
MRRDLLSDAVRAAGFAMATSEELLGVSSKLTLVCRPQPGQSEKAVSQALVPKLKWAEGRSLRTFFGALAVWA